MQKPKISIIGLGKLGAPMVAAYASKGYEVIGVDVNLEFVRLISEGKAPVLETDLPKYLNENQKRISATQNFEKAILESAITFIIVPTPSKPDGDFSTEYAVKAAKEIGRAIKNKTDFHVIVLTSTVTPGSTKKDILPILEEYSGKKCGVDFGLCYNPEFIALGSVIKNLLNPDFVLIGESDKKSGDILEEFYKNTCENNPLIKRMEIINAEITKIALNTYVTTKISYANMLAELCEEIPGGNVDVVTDALGCDTRIGKKYLKGALGYMGPCFPRDNRALIRVAEKFSVPFPLAKATDEVNRHQVPRLTEKIFKLLPAGGKLTILGLSYKPNSNVVEESQPVEMAKIFSERDFSVVVYDPAAMDNTKKILNKVIFANSFKEAVKEADVILISTPWEEFKNIESSQMKAGSIIFDCWRILDPVKFQEKAKYFAIGINS